MNNNKINTTLARLTKKNRKDTKYKYENSWGNHYQKEGCEKFYAHKYDNLNSSTSKNYKKSLRKTNNMKCLVSFEEIEFIVRQQAELQGHNFTGDFYQPFKE